MEDTKSVRAAFWAKTTSALVRRRSSLLSQLMRMFRHSSWSADARGADTDETFGKTDASIYLSGRVGLGALPYDTLLMVFMNLDVADIVSLSQVCRYFHETSQEWVIWNNAAFKMLCRSRILHLDDFVHPATLCAADLRQVILRTHRLDRNWTGQEPSVTCPPTTVKLSAPETVVSKFLCCASFYVSERAMILPRQDGWLVGLDPKTGAVLGTYNMEQKYGIYTLHAHPASNSIFAVVAEPSDVHLRLSVLNITFPGDGANKTMEFKPVADFMLPNAWGLLTVIANTNYKRLCMLFLNPLDGTLKLFVVLDWDTGLSAVIDTDLPYESGQGAIVIRFTDDGEELVVFSDTLRQTTWIQRCYSLSELRTLSSNWQAATLNGPIRLAPVKETTFVFDNIDPRLSETSLYQYWTSTHSWIRYPGLPIHLSYILLYVDTTPTTPEWYIVQYYTTEDQPCSSQRFMVKMHDPVTLPYGSHGLPLMSPSFNHLCWIDQVEGRRGGRKVKKRVLKLVTFPEDGRRDQVETKTLHVPRRILDRVCHVFVEPGMGAVLLTTRKNELHRFQYA